MTPGREKEIRERIVCCAQQVKESPYSHTIAAGWYIDDTPELLAELSSLRGRVEQAEAESERLRRCLQREQTLGSELTAQANALRARVEQAEKARGPLCRRYAYDAAALAPRCTCPHGTCVLIPYERQLAAARAAVSTAPEEQEWADR